MSGCCLVFTDSIILSILTVAKPNRTPFPIPTRTPCTMTPSAQTEVAVTPKILTTGEDPTRMPSLLYYFFCLFCN